jgi:hypothetical protein
VRRLPVLLSAAALIAGGVIRAIQHGLEGSLLAGAGLVVLGAWLSAELRDRDQDK